LGLFNTVRSLLLQPTAQTSITLALLREEFPLSPRPGEAASKDPAEMDAS